MFALQDAPAWTHQNGVVIVHGEHNTFGVMVPDGIGDRVLKIEVDWRGRRWKEEFMAGWTNGLRDRLDVPLSECMIRVKEGDTVLAELGSQPQGPLYQPWMVRQGEQAYETESGVSVPPALHITDEVGARWTLGFRTAPAGQGPRGEFAFNVLRDGIDMGQIASRIECKNGQVRIFTAHGWKRWLGCEWS